MAGFNLVQWREEADKLPIGHYIIRINEQRGSFKDVSEIGLQAELAHGASAIDDDIDLMSEDDFDEPIDKSREELWKHKEEALQDVNQAHTESAFGRDFVSLVLTASQPTQASMTISQPLKDRVPMGSIGQNIVRSETPSAQEQNKDRHLTGGLELEAFNSTIDSIVSAAERLERDVRSETRYWQGIVEIERQGWMLRRMPREERSLGIRIGSLESGTGYRGKGLVKLRQTPDGSVGLDLAGDVAKGRRLRVQAYHKGAVLASHLLPRAHAGDQDPLQDSIIRARDSLFDEELFYELSREAGQLWNRGIKFTEKGIVMPVAKDVEMVMDLASEADSGQVAEFRKSDQVDEYSSWPEAFATTLRILLTTAHRQNKNKRAASPQALTGRSKSRQVYPLLLPILSQLQHYAAEYEIDSLASNIQQLFSSIYVNVVLRRSDNTAQLLSLVDGSEQQRTGDLVDRFSSLLSNPTPSSFDIEFPEISVRLRAMFRTLASGTEYRYVVATRPGTSALAHIPPDMVFQDSAELKAAVLDLARMCLIETIQHITRHQWQSTLPQTGEMQRRETVVSTTINELLRVNLSETRVGFVVVRQDDVGTNVVDSWDIDIDAEHPIDIFERLDSVSKM